MLIDEQLSPIKLSSMRTTIKVVKRKMSDDNTSEIPTPLPDLNKTVMI
jgi:hypothetical protein